MTGSLYTVGAPRWSESEFLPNFSLKTGDEVNQNTSFGLDNISVKSWVLWWFWAHSGGQVASYKCPSPASTTAVVALDHGCINFLAEAEKADSLSLSLPPPTLSSCLPVAAFAISGPASSTTNWSSQPRAICESSPRLHVVERIRISNTLNILKLLENFFMVVLSPQVRVESYFTLLFHLISFQIVGTAACVFGSTICMIFVLSIKLLVMVARFLWPDFRNDRSEYNRICC